jgi:hypothetical protein
VNEPAPLVKKTAPLWAHVLAYWVFYFAVGGLLTAVGVTLAARSTDRQVEGVWWVVFCSVLLVALVICVWPRFLFLKRDIRQLIRSRGGRVLSGAAGTSTRPLGPFAW